VVGCAAGRTNRIHSGADDCVRAHEQHFQSRGARTQARGTPPSPGESAGGGAHMETTWELADIEDSDFDVLGNKCY
jgi:hypothetical protein